MIRQLLYITYGILSLPLLPLLFYLGIRARKKAGKLPDAMNPRGIINGSNPGFRIAVIGESTVAGVGVEDHREGVTGQLAAAVAGSTGREVNWEAFGATGYTVKKIREETVHKLLGSGSTPDVVVIMLGGNDTFKLNTPLHWRRGMKDLIGFLRSHFNGLIVIANLPPVSNFPAMAPLLRWYLGGLTNLHRKVIRDLPEEFDDLVYMSDPIDFDYWRKMEGRDVPADEFFSDGIHPSALTYRLWAGQIGEMVLDYIRSGK